MKKKAFGEPTIGFINFIRTISFKLFKEWVTLFSIMLKPLVFLPIGLGVISLYLANFEVEDSALSLILNIMATILTAIAGGAFFDELKNMMGNTILIKKGSSAVRNLSTTRIKVKNIYERSKKSALKDEIDNLLLLIEKDIANSIQEWNDILPGVEQKEIAYLLLEEKEKELEDERKDKEFIITRLRDEQTLKSDEKVKLFEELKTSNEKIKLLSSEVDRLKILSNLPTTASGTSGTSGYPGFTLGIGGTSYRSPGTNFETIIPGSGAQQLCNKCGTWYPVGTLFENGLCVTCNMTRR